MDNDTTTAAERVREAAERLQRIANGELGVAVYFPDHRGSVHANNTLDRAADLARDDRRTLADAYLAQQPTYEQQAAEIERLKEESQWIRRKLKLPEDASSSDVYGQMHVLDSNSHGFSAYIAAYKCDDKQGEIARLTHANAAQSAEIAELRAKVEAEKREHLATQELHERSMRMIEEAIGPERDKHDGWRAEVSAKAITELRARAQAFDDERPVDEEWCRANGWTERNDKSFATKTPRGNWLVWDAQTKGVYIGNHTSLGSMTIAQLRHLLAAIGGAK